MADLREVIPATPARQYYGAYVRDRCINPDHRDSNPSMLIWSHRFNCLSCNFWGTEWNGQKGERLTTDASSTRARSAVPDLPFELALQYHATLSPDKAAYYHSRGLTRGTIRRFLLGYGCPPDSETPRYAIPIIEGHNLVNVKFRLDPSVEDEATTDKKYIGVTGHNHAHLWGIDGVAGHRKVLVVGGEIDRIHAFQDLFPEFYPVNGTGGEGTWLPDWNGALRSAEKLFVCLDGDKAGQAAQDKVCRSMRDGGLFPIPIHLPPDPKDVDSFLREHGTDGFKRLVPSQERLWFMAYQPGVYWRHP